MHKYSFRFSLADYTKSRIKEILEARQGLSAITYLHILNSDDILFSLGGWFRLCLLKSYRPCLVIRILKEQWRCIMF